MNVTGGYKGLQKIMWGYKGNGGLQRFTGGFKGIQAVTARYRVLQGVPEGYKR